MDNLYSSVSKGGCYDTNHYGPRPLPLLKSNYLSEYTTEAEKERVRLSLGIHNDSLFRKFIVKNDVLLDQIPNHKDIGTIYNAFKDLYSKTDYLQEDIDAENERIISLESGEISIKELQESAIKVLLGSVPNKYSELLGEGYEWPKSLSGISGGYLKGLYDYIKDVEGKIGELPDGSDALTYIDNKNKEILDLIGEYKTNTVDDQGNPIDYNKYGGNNNESKIYTLKEAIDDLDFRLTSANEILSDANLITQKLENYKTQVNDGLKEINGGVLSSGLTVIGLKQEIVTTKGNLIDQVDSVKQAIQEKIGESGDNASGLYKKVFDFETYLKQELETIKLEEIGNYSSEEVKASGIRKEIEEMNSTVSDLLNNEETGYKKLLENKVSELIGLDDPEHITHTGIYKYINEHADKVSEGIKETADLAVSASEEASKLVYGDPNSEDEDKRLSLGLRVLNVKDEILKAESATKEVIEANKSLGDIHLVTRTGLSTQISENISGYKELKLGALNFYINGYHWRGFAPALGSDSIETINVEDPILGWRKAYNISENNTRDYSGAFGLLFSDSDTASVTLNTKSFNKTGKTDEKYTIPTIEFEATNVEIVDSTSESAKTSNKLKIEIVTTRPVNPDPDTFYFIKES